MAGAVVVDPSFGGWNHVDIQRLDVAWNAAIESDRVAKGLVELDLSKVEYLDQECLLFLVAIVLDRHKRNRSTRIRLPESPLTLDFLRAWDFPRSVELATDREFPSFLDEHDRKTFAEVERNPSRYLKVVTMDSGGRETLLPVSFFAITPISLADSEKAATLVRDEWLDSHLVSVLNRHLDGNGNRVATNVLHEGVLNAAMHPAASVAFTSSQLLAKPRPSRDPIEEGDRELVIAIWDNGASFSDTLSRAWQEYGTVASPAYGLVDDVFDFSVVDRRMSRTFKRRIHSTDDVASLRRQSSLVLAAFLLGVSATPLRAHAESQLRDVDAGLLPEEGKFHSGIGLHVIRKTAIDLFHGSVSYAAGSLRLEIQSGGSAPGTYAASLTRRLASDAQVAGNLLIARLRLPGSHADG